MVQPVFDRCFLTVMPLVGSFKYPSEDVVHIFTVDKAIPVGNAGCSFISRAKCSMHSKTYASSIISFLQSLKDGLFDICRQRKVLKILCRAENVTVVTIHRDNHLLKVAEISICYQTSLASDLLFFFFARFFERP